MKWLSLDLSAENERNKQNEWVCYSNKGLISWKDISMHCKSDIDHSTPTHPEFSYQIQLACKISRDSEKLEKWMNWWRIVDMNDYVSFASQMVTVQKHILLLFHTLSIVFIW